MALSLFDVSIPVLVRGLSNLSAIIDKAAAHAEAKKLDPTALAQARLFPDMFPLARQVQVTCDTAKGAAARLAGIEIPKHEDNETTLPELKQRLAKTLDELHARVRSTLAYLNGFTAADFASAATRVVTQPRWEGKTMTGADYFLEHVLPNFFFHTTHVFAILRHNGVEVGKGDYLGEI